MRGVYAGKQDSSVPVSNMKLFIFISTIIKVQISSSGLGCALSVGHDVGIGCSRELRRYIRYYNKAKLLSCTY